MNTWFASAPESLIWVVLGTIVMYGVVLSLARWSGVRSFAQLSVFDVAVTIAIGSLLATTVASEDPPLLQGIAATATLYVLQLLVSRIRTFSSRVEHITDNLPILLMGANGTIKHENLRVARVTEEDLRSHLRKANVLDIGHVQAVVMEGNGAISVLHHHETRLPAGSWILQGVRDYEDD